jgi:hypothetical protein
LAWDGLFAAAVLSRSESSTKLNRVARRSAVRVDGVVARDAPVAVIFRRGPSRWTAVVPWHLETDEVTVGDWLRGRLYSRRCDLSPDGGLLVYFAANFGSAKQPAFRYGHSWTAISKPPSLEPLAYWPKFDCWAGGGTFERNDHLLLNEAGGVATPSDPPGLTVRFDPSARGEDEPLYGRRLERDGFRLVQPLQATYQPGGFVTSQAEIRVRATADGQRLRLTRSLQGFTDVHLYGYVSERGEGVDLRDASWAEFDHRDRLICAQHGRLLALEGAGFELIADLNEFDPPAP